MFVHGADVQCIPLTRPNSRRTRFIIIKRVHDYVDAVAAVIITREHLRIVGFVLYAGWIEADFDAYITAKL